MSLKPLRARLSISASCTCLKTSGGHLHGARLVGHLTVRIQTGGVHGDRQHRRDERFAQLLRNHDGMAVRHHRVAAEDVLRSAFLGSPGYQEDGGPPVLELLRHLGVGEQFEVDDVVGVDLGAGGRRGQEERVMKATAFCMRPPRITVPGP